ncbi:coiled-coil domain-containing protein [Oceanivirga miroungae]|uniref:Uncharacterized protein n=1 Tax=Oceanivirga miroungae TaxID=1130046 RepID=A0A6I8MCR9_9FUSO|nr:hypothetical protein [Oceanivirga miroungae]VWL84906.1 hypothetical protein OMES3154_00163 [Oceanivirga miroungae]
MYRYYDIDFKNSKNTYFGYLEKNGIILFIFMQKEGDLETNTNEILVNFIVTEFLEKQEFSSKFLKNLIIRTNDLFNEKKTCELGLKFLSSSIMLVLSNKSKYLIASSGNIQASVFDKDEKLKLRTRLDNIAYELYENKEITFDMIAENKYRKEVTNCLGGLKQLAINMTGELELELMDTILIEGINSWDNTNKEIDFAKIKIKKIEKKEKGRKNSFLIIGIIILFSIFTLFILNNKRIKVYEDKINEVKENIKIYEKNKVYKNIGTMLLELENIYKDLYKAKAIYIPRKLEIEYVKDTEYIKRVREDIITYNEIEKEISQSKLDIKNNEYIVAYNKLDKIKNNKLKYKLDTINTLIIESNDLQKAYNNLEKIDDLLENEKYEDLKLLLSDTKKIYMKYKRADLINTFLEPVYEKMNDKIESLKAIIEKTIESYKTMENKNLALVKLDDAFNLAKRVGDNDLLDRIENDRKLLDSEIKNLKEEIEVLKLEAKQYMNEKKYRVSLEAFLEVNKKLKKLDLISEINENNKTIRKIKELIRKEKKPTIIKNKKNEVEGEIIKSIYLSIEKGDEYISNNEFKNAYEEYKRALDLSNKVKIPNITIKKLKDKMKYSYEKINSAWW